MEIFILDLVMLLHSTAIFNSESSSKSLQNLDITRLIEVKRNEVFEVTDFAFPFS